MLDPAIKIDNIESATGFDPVTLLATGNKVITYHVGHFGPFKLTIRDVEFDQQHIEAKLNHAVETLRLVGAVPA
jgi:hypothetical protein